MLILYDRRERLLDRMLYVVHKPVTVRYICDGPCANHVREKNLLYLDRKGGAMFVYYARLSTIDHGIRRRLLVLIALNLSSLCFSLLRVGLIRFPC